MISAPIPSTGPTEEALEPLARALRLSATRCTDNMTKDARRDADARVGAACREANAIVEQARREGAAVADAILVRERAALRREAAGMVMAAKRSVIDDLNRRVSAAVLDLRNERDYASLLEGLAARGRARLGDNAIVTIDPDDAGGVIVELDNRRIDYTLPALAARAVADLGDAVDELLR